MRNSSTWFYTEHIITRVIEKTLKLECNAQKTNKNRTVQVDYSGGTWWNLLRNRNGSKWGPPPMARPKTHLGFPAAIAFTVSKS